MCAYTFCPTCPAVLPCGIQRPCRFTCPEPPPACLPTCLPPIPCTPCPPCRCEPICRPCPPPLVPDILPPIVPILPICRPRRCPPYECPPPPPPRPVCCPPVLPCCPPPVPCDPPPIKSCPEPIPCYQPVLPCCNPQCPPTIIPKQRPICPRPPRVPIGCIPVSRSCCPDCELDPVTRRRPLMVHDSIFQCRPTGYPPQRLARFNPNVRFNVKGYSKKQPQSNCYSHVDVRLP